METVDKIGVNHTDVTIKKEKDDEPEQIYVLVNTKQEDEMLIPDEDGLIRVKQEDEMLFPNEGSEDSFYKMERLSEASCDGNKDLKKCEMSHHGVDNYHQFPHYKYKIFNVKFVGEIEKHPELYNYTLQGYSKRDVTEKAWTQIAKEMNMSVNECKEKWRNLRSTFAKNLKGKPSGSDASRKKPYYLMDAMQFAIPFIKVSGNPTSNLPENIQQTASASSTLDVTMENATQGTEDSVASLEVSPVFSPPNLLLEDQTTPSTSTSGRGPHGHPIRKRKSASSQHQDADQAFSSYFAAKTAKLSTVKESSSREKGIRHFLLSLLPDLTQINDQQLRNFKRKALLLVEEVCDNPQPLVPPRPYQPSGFPSPRYFTTLKSLQAPEYAGNHSDHSPSSEDSSF